MPEQRLGAPVPAVLRRPGWRAEARMSMTRHPAVPYDRG